MTSTTFCYSEKKSVPTGVEGEDPINKHHAVCEGIIASVRAIVHCTGWSEVTAGKKYLPFDASEVKNGALIVHSSELSAHQEAFDKATRKFIIGASKAAVEVLQTLDPDDENVIWSHRGHVIFTNRTKMESKAAEAASEDMEALKVERREGRKAAIKEKRTGNMLLKKQMFSAYSKMYLSSGLGHSVGEPLSKSGIAQRGGIESEEGLAHCRKFLPRQKILDSLNVVDGALNIIAARTRPVFDGEVIVPEKGDVVVLATGQRAEGFGEGYHRACAENNKDGAFTPFAVSGSASCIATYWTSMIVDYLDGTPNAYSDNRFSDAAMMVAQHMETVQDRSPWALSMTYLAANQLDTAHLVFPWEAVGAGDLAGSPRWNEWYGRHLAVRASCALLKAEEYDDSAETLTGSTVELAVSDPSHPALLIK